MLRKTYFGGGTVLSSSAEDRFHALRPGYAGFEDGTLPFLAFPAVLHSFSAWQHRGGFPAAEKAAHAAASQFAKQLLAMKHGNGSPVATVYGQWQSNLLNSSPSSENRNSLTTNNKINKNNVVSGQGPTITFNLLDSSGNWVGHRQVQRIASLEGIYLRTGVMCNPGACSTATGVKAIQAKTWFENGHVCWDDQDVLDGVPTGAVRVSFGWGSGVNDADALAEFVHRHFVSSFGAKPKETKSEAAAVAVAVEKNENSIENFNLFQKEKKHDDLRIQSLTIYPIKSAAGFSPRSWPVSPSFGLLYDRHCAIVDAHGAILTLKKCPQLNVLHPVVCLEDRVMRIHAKGMNKLPLEIPLPNIGLIHDEEEEKDDAGGAGGVDVGINRKTTTPISSSSSSFTSEWLTEVLGIPCSLIEYKYQNDSSNLPAVVAATKNNGVESKKKAKSPHHGFSNEAQILLVTVASLQAIYKKSDIESSFEKFAERFRPNIIVEEKYLPSTLSPSFTEEEKEEVNRGEIVEKEDELVAFKEEEWTSINLHNGNNLDNTLHSLGRKLDSTARTDTSIECDVVGCCPRCEMICIDPNTGFREGAEPLLTLAKERKGAGKRRFCFGVLLNVKSKSGSSEEQVKENAKMSRVAVGMHLDYETHSEQ